MTEKIYSLWQKYERRAYSTCLKIVRNPMDADEVVEQVQEACLLNLHTGWTEYQTWRFVYKVCINKSVDFIRKRKKLDIAKAGFFQGLALSLTADEHRERDKRIHFLISSDRLTEREKQILHHLLEGRSLKEIEKLMPISYSTIKRDFQNILKISKSILENYDSM